MTVILQSISSCSAVQLGLMKWLVTASIAARPCRNQPFFFYNCLIDRRELEPLEIVVVLLGKPLTRGSYLDLVF